MLVCWSVAVTLCSFHFFQWFCQSVACIFNRRSSHPRWALEATQRHFFPCAFPQLPDKELKLPPYYFVATLKRGKIDNSSVHGFDRSWGFLKCIRALKLDRFCMSFAEAVMASIERITDCSSLPLVSALVIQIGRYTKWLEMLLTLNEARFGQSQRQSWSKLSFGWFLTEWPLL